MRERERERERERDKDRDRETAPVMKAYDNKSVGNPNSMLLFVLF